MKRAFGYQQKDQGQRTTFELNKNAYLRRHITTILYSVKARASGFFAEGEGRQTALHRLEIAIGNRAEERNRLNQALKEGVPVFVARS